MIEEDLKDKWFLRDVVNDDREGYEVIHEGESIAEFSDCIETLFVIESFENGKEYGILVTRQGNPDEPIWDYDFLGEYEEREIVTTEWVAKKS